MEVEMTSCFSGSVVSENTARHTKDIDAKWILRHCDVLAKIVQYAIPEFKDCSYNEIVGTIPVDTIKIGEVAVNSDFVKLDSNEIPRLNEKPIVFDVLFRDTRYNLMIDIEPQGTFNPGYSLVKRGMYYLSRMLSSQLIPKKDTNYNALRKCYSIWLCFDLLSNSKTNAVGEHRYKMRHVTEDGTEFPVGDADLMELIIVRAGGQCDLNRTLREFITALFRDTDKLASYLAESEECKDIIKEANTMCNWGEMRETQGRAMEIIRMGQKYNLSRECIIRDLMDECHFSRDEAEDYYCSYIGDRFE